MRKSFIVLLLVLAMLCGCAGRSKPFGIGFVVAGPTGIAAKGWTNQRMAVAGAIGFSKNATIFQVDHLWHNAAAFSIQFGDLIPYYGIGFRAELKEDAVDESGISIRFPLGLDYIFESDAVDLFFEIVPMLDVTPDVAFDVDAALGVRFFF